MFGKLRLKVMCAVVVLFYLGPVCMFSSIFKSISMADYYMRTTAEERVELYKKSSESRDLTATSGNLAGLMIFGFGGAAGTIWAYRVLTGLSSGKIRWKMVCAGVVLFLVAPVCIFSVVFHTIMSVNHYMTTTAEERVWLYKESPRFREFALTFENVASLVIIASLGAGGTVWACRTLSSERRNRTRSLGEVSGSAQVPT